MDRFQSWQGQCSSMGAVPLSCQSSQPGGNAHGMSSPHAARREFLSVQDMPTSPRRENGQVKDEAGKRGTERAWRGLNGSCTMLGLRVLDAVLHHGYGVAGGIPFSWA